MLTIEVVSNGQSDVVKPKSLGYKHLWTILTVCSNTFKTFKRPSQDETLPLDLKDIERLWWQTGWCGIDTWHCQRKREPSKNYQNQTRSTMKQSFTQTFQSSITAKLNFICATTIRSKSRVKTHWKHNITTITTNKFMGWCSGQWISGINIAKNRKPLIFFCFWVCWPSYAFSTCSTKYGY